MSYVAGQISLPYRRPHVARTLSAEGNLQEVLADMPRLVALLVHGLGMGHDVVPKGIAQCAC